MQAYKHYSVPILLFFFFTLFACSADTLGKDTMNSNSSCSQTAVKKSQELIRFILNDLSETYTHVGGGGITDIKLSATNTYIVSIAQEERIDQITYELEIDKDCKITILDRTVSAVSPWQK